MPSLATPVPLVAQQPSEEGTGYRVPSEEEGSRESYRPSVEEEDEFAHFSYSNLPSLLMRNLELLKASESESLRASPQTSRPADRPADPAEATTATAGGGASSGGQSGGGQGGGGATASGGQSGGEADSAGGGDGERAPAAVRPPAPARAAHDQPELLSPAPVRAALSPAPVRAALSPAAVRAATPVYARSGVVLQNGFEPSGTPASLQPPASSLQPPAAAAARAPPAVVSIPHCSSPTPTSSEASLREPSLRRASVERGGASSPAPHPLSG